MPVLMLLFALGEQFGWWDKLTGRAAAKTGLERFRSAEGYPKTWIYKDRMEDRKIFEALEKRINQKTSSETVKRT